MILAAYHDRPCMEENQGTITEEEAAFLYGLALTVRPRCIAEVGTGWRRSLRAFVQAADQLKAQFSWDCRVWSCDTDKGRYDAAREACGGANLVHGDSSALADIVQPAPELVFIDGDHTEKAIERDFFELRDIAAPGCVFVFHDTALVFNAAPAAFAKKIGAILLPTPRGMALLVS